MKKHLLAIMLVVRMFFDDSIPCLGIDDNCEETESPVKDDLIYPPTESEEPDFHFGEELYDPPNPIEDEDNLIA